MADDPNDSFDVFVHDRATETTLRVSAGPEARYGALLAPSISADGPSVAFYSLSDDLVDGDTASRNTFPKPPTAGS